MDKLLENLKERNLQIMAHNTAIVMRTYMHFADDGTETELVAPDDADGFLFIKAAVLPKAEPLDLEAEMLKRGWLWVGVKEGPIH